MKKTYLNWALLFAITGCGIETIQGSQTEDETILEDDGLSDEEKALAAKNIPVMMHCNLSDPTVYPLEITKSSIRGSELSLDVKYPVNATASGKQTFFACPYTEDADGFQSGNEDPAKVTLYVTMTDTATGAKNKTKTSTISVNLRSLETRFHNEKGVNATGDINITIAGSTELRPVALLYRIGQATPLEASGIRASNKATYMSESDSPVYYVEAKNSGSSSKVTESKIRRQFGISNDYALEIYSKKDALESLKGNVAVWEDQDGDNEQAKAWKAILAFAENKIGSSLVMVKIGHKDETGGLSWDSGEYTYLYIGIKNGLIFGFKYLSVET